MECPEKCLQTINNMILSGAAENKWPIKNYCDSELNFGNHQHWHLCPRQGPVIR